MVSKLVEDLNEEVEDQVLSDVGYTREQLKADLFHIKEWLKEQHHLPTCRLKESDVFLQWFLTGCKGSLEKTKKKLDNYYTFRGYSEIFENRDPLAPEYVTNRNMFYGGVALKPGYNGNRLSIMKFSAFDGDKYDFLVVMRVLFNSMEIHTRNVGINSRSCVMFDCRGASPSFVSKMRPSVMRDFIFFLEEVLPYRYIRISFIYTPSYIEVAVNTLMKPFMTKKLKERFHVTSGGPEDLFDHFSPSIFPRDYGGDSSNPTLKELNDLWVKYEQDNREWYLNELSERTDESKRIVTDKTPKNPYFGVHGSLKKLVID